MEKTYSDEKGYLRFKDTNELVHRKVAYKKYDENRSMYAKPFSEYHIHHIDKDKQNNDPSNLALVTPEEHERIHNIGKNSFASSITGVDFFVWGLVVPLIFVVIALQAKMPILFAIIIAVIFGIISLGIIASHKKG